MSYTARFLAKISEVPTGGTDKTDKTATQRTRQFNSDELTRPTTLSSPVSPVSEPRDEPSRFTPPWPPRPSALAEWSLSRRQRWGELANAFEDRGVPFPDSERQAFDEVKAEERDGRGSNARR